MTYDVIGGRGGGDLFWISLKEYVYVYIYMCVCVRFMYLFIHLHIDIWWSYSVIT